MHDPVDLARLVLLSAGAALLIARLIAAPRDPSGRGLLIPMLVVGLLGAAAYPRFGQLREYPNGEHHAYHLHDLWHYAQGAAYYPELGYSRLYECTWVAASELEAEGEVVPSIDRIRRLDAIMSIIEVPEQAAGMAEDCHAAFSPSRWAAFKADTRMWFRRGAPDDLWREMLLDLGFNPPPSWAVLGHSLLRVVPLTPVTIELLPALDFGLLFGVGSAFVLWAFGPWALCAYWLVLGCNYAADPLWTGGSYGRHIWAASLVAGVASLHKEKWTAAGVLLGLSASMRVFPAVFLAGAGLALLRRALVDRDRRPLLELCGGAGAVGGTLVGASLLMFGLDPWFAFFDKIQNHGATYFAMHIGFKKWATFSMEAAGRNFGGVGGLTRMAEWNALLDDAWHRHWVTNQLLRGSLLALAGWAAWRRPPAHAAILVGAAAIFFLTMPANYYTVWIALVPAVWLGEPTTRWTVVRMLAVFGMLLGFMLGPALGGFEPFLHNFWWNRAMFAFVATWILTAALETELGGRSVWATLSSHRLVTMAGAVVLVGGWMAGRVAEQDHRPNLVLVTVEGLRADHVGEATPNLNRIAKHAWTATVTSDVRTAHAALHQVLTGADGRSLARALADDGFVTMAAPSRALPPLVDGVYRTRMPERGPTMSGRVTAVANSHLQYRSDDRPFFLWVHYDDPLPPLVQLPAEPAARTQAERYDLEVARVDMHLNRFLSNLRAHALMRDSVVVVLGTWATPLDGEPPGDLPMWVLGAGVQPGQANAPLALEDVVPQALDRVGARR